jgi:hypothetical protein
MKEKEYLARIDKIIDLSWQIFKEQFINGRITITKEAPFQHHFANIIKTVGDLFCIKRNELFFTDLETKCPNIKNKNKYFDITCGFIINQKEIKASLELKFKTKLQGAQDFGRIDSYVDIEALEQSLERGYITGRFFMITDSTAYINKSKKGVGTIFAMHKEHMSKPGIFQSKVCKGRENVMIELKDTYKFDWEYLRNFYFLELKINK